jgi:DNA polymerase-3 subunit delta
MRPQAGEILPVYLLAGEQDFLKEAELKRIKSAVSGNSGLNPTDYNVFYGEEANGLNVARTARTLPFMSGRRLVVLKGANLLNRSDMEAVISYVNSPSRSTCLVLTVSTAKPQGELFDAVCKSGKVLVFRQLGADGIARWVHQCFGKFGKSIDKEGVDTLLEKIGTDMSAVEREVEKIVTYVGQRPRISAGDVELLAGRSSTRSSFALGDTIAERNATGALEVLSDFVREGMKPPLITGILFSYLKRVHDNRLMVQKGTDDAKMAWAFKGDRHRRFMNHVRSYPLRHLKDAFGYLLRTDIRCKGTDISPEVLLEILVLRLCGFRE